MTREQNARRRSDINDELARPSQEGREWEERRAQLLAELEKLEKGNL
jgi:hypothetical protein